ncbi:MAG: pilus assembly protein PilM [Patescibacteria group bacterium]|nr:pilus assembly protein PilM [Patescibacteria group bacterium]
MRARSFFRVFPPPAFLAMPYAGVDISDDAVKCLTYSGFGRERRIASYGSMDLPEGLIDGGDIKDEKAFVELMTGFARRHGLTFVKVSVPEEKSYLFQTEVPDPGSADIEQNIEFKIEENVPLSGPDAVFYFDLVPRAAEPEPPRASVSVVPRTYIEHYMGLLESAGMKPVAFEVVPKSIARAAIPAGQTGAMLIIHAMKRKTGIYVVSGDAVSFASTLSNAPSGEGEGSVRAIESIGKEASRIYSYWLSHGTGRAIDGIILVGAAARELQGIGRFIADARSIPVRVAGVWANVFDIDRYIPPITEKESLGYAVAAGLALDPSLS